MENPGVLNWRGWSVVQKAQVIGAATGALITVGMPLILKAYDDGQFAFLLLWSCGILLWPAGEICNLFGWTWRIEISEGPSLVQSICAIFTNALLFFLFGTLIGWIIFKLKKPRKEF